MGSEKGAWVVVMTECHKCEHREKVEAGRYAKTPFKRTPCGKCELKEVSLRTMEVDLNRPAFVPGADGPKEPTYEMEFCIEPEGEEKLPVGILEELVARLLSLPRDLRDVVCWRFVGMEYKEIAWRQQITASGAERRHERAMRLFPELRELFLLKTVRRRMREEATVRASENTEAYGC
jgi:hypothetical protein